MGLWHYVYVSIEDAKILCLKHGYTIKVELPNKETGNDK